jgi:crotonobetainyl-CoA:carnitine CoA-transferase CaiB-like acyl-CoA transferase
MSVLKGIRVLDFGRYVAGPYCATLLGYLGAEVIRIEKRDGGEDRYIAPLFDGGEGGVFFQTACNKKSLTLDPAAPRGREIVDRLVATADVVVANLPPATLAALGLDYQNLRRIKRDIILASQTAFGDHGPYAELGGFDGVGQAMSGAMFITGTPGAPVKAAAPYVDFSTAVLSALGTLAALMHRERTGEGQEVATSLLGTALSVFGSHLIEQGVTHRDRIGTGNRVQTSAPSDVFPTRDGHLLVHVVGNPLFRRWARLMGEERRWIDDPAYANDALRGANSAVDAHGQYYLDRRELDFRAKVFPFEESGSVLKSVVGAVLTPLSNALEVKLTGSLEKPDWAFVIGPTNFFRTLGGADTPADGESPKAPPAADKPSAAETK